MSVSHSAILAMHAAYETAMGNIEKIDRASSSCTNSDRDIGRRSINDRTATTLSKEGRLLTLAILHQVPDSFEEAIILQFHLWNVVDLIQDDETGEQEKEAMIVAADTLFDFMACEFGGIDHQAIGQSFKDGTMLAFKRRRIRTGDAEELA